MVAMHKKLMIIKPYFIRLPKNDQPLLKKKARNCLLINICKEKKNGIKIFRTQYKEARKSGMQ
jgi:hypothetical protein